MWCRSETNCSTASSPLPLAWCEADTVQYKSWKLTASLHYCCPWSRSMMSPTFGMHKVVYLVALTVLIDSYVNRKSEEKLDFLEKTAAWLTRHVTIFRQQANTKCTKRKKQMDEEEEKEDDVMSEVSRQLPTHQNRPVTKKPQGYDRQHSVSTPT